MLVLSRKLGESIIIAGDIKVTIVDVTGNHVRVGIEAPRDVPIHRHEIQDILNQKKKLAEHLDRVLPAASTAKLT